VLGSWRDTPTRAAIVDYVERRAPEVGRVAVFDNDGTLWCEKPLPIQLDFTLRRLAEQAQGDVALRERQPYKAAYEHDLAWLGGAMTRHYQGDDADLRLLMAAIEAAFGGMDVEAYERRVADFFAEATHPTLGRPYTACAYQPMVELLRYLEANGFATFIASGGDRDFMRAVAEDVYGIPREHVIGSGMGLEWRDEGLVYKSKIEFFDDGPEKPVRIWNRVGRRPLVAGGNANGDAPMLRFAGPDGLRLVVRHDDPEREFGYVAEAQDVLGAGHVEISVRDDWATVFEEA
jgi:FMN phosphatase YigB (HAD superfamily)